MENVKYPQHHLGYDIIIMMKNSFKILLFSFLCAFFSCAAFSYYDDECGTPLFKGQFAVQLHGGAVPTFWNGRDEFLLANASTNTTFCPVLQLSGLGCLPKFSSLYKCPWDVGFRISYALSEKVDFGIDFDYRTAGPKNKKCPPGNQLSLCYTTSLDLVSSVSLSQFVFNEIGSYKAYLGHASMRWYSERCWCDSLAFFIGIKMGFVHHKRINATLNFYTFESDGTSVISTTSPFPALVAPLYYTNTVISGGGTVGLDWCFWRRWAFVAQFEFLGQGPLFHNSNFGGPDLNVGSQGDQNNSSIAGTTSCNNIVNLIVSNAAPTSNLVVPSFKVELQFPIIFGFKYYL